MGVFPVAVIFGLLPAVVFASGSALLWDFFFIPPQFTFAIQTSENAMMNLTYFVVAIVSGILGTRVRRQEFELKQKERDAKLLYELENNLSKQNDVGRIMSESASFFDRHFGIRACVIDGSSGELDFTSPKLAEQLSEVEQKEAAWVYRNEQRAGLQTLKFSNSRLTYLPLGGDLSSSGVLVLYSQSSGLNATENLILKFCQNIGMALERERYRFTTRRNQLLESSEKLHQTLLNSVSHELRTPITAILGDVSELLNRPDSDRVLKSALDIRASAVRLNQTVTNLLDLSRVQSGTLQLNRNIIEVNDFIYSCLASAGSSTDSLRFEVSESTQSLYIKGDERLLETAVLNLIRNAITHSPTESKIQITVSEADAEVKLNFADKGPGIKKGEEEKVFSHFYTLSGGLGLGLPIVRAIVEAHHGRVVLEQSSESGSVFQITLPRVFLPLDFDSDSEGNDGKK